MFSSLGSQVTLIVSRQQVLPQKDPEVAAALEDELLRRGRAAVQGRPGRGHRPHRRRRRGGALRRRPGGRGQPRAAGHRLDPQQRRARARRRRGRGRRRRLRAGQPPLRHERAAHLRRRRPVGEAAAVVGGVDAGPQDRRARHGAAHPGRTATSTTTRRRRPSSPSPRSPTSAWPRPTPSPRAARCGSPRCRSRRRPRRSSTTRPTGFVKILSDPATGVVLGGSIVGRHGGRADLGRWPWRSPPACGSTTSSRACSCTRRWPRRWPTPPSDRHRFCRCHSVGAAARLSASRSVDGTRPTGGVAADGRSPQLVELAHLGCRSPPTSWSRRRRSPRRSSQPRRLRWRRRARSHCVRTARPRWCARLSHSITHGCRATPGRGARRSRRRAPRTGAPDRAARPTAPARTAVSKSLSPKPGRPKPLRQHRGSPGGPAATASWQLAVASHDASSMSAAAAGVIERLRHEERVGDRRQVEDRPRRSRCTGMPSTSSRSTPRRVRLSWTVQPVALASPATWCHHLDRPTVGARRARRSAADVRCDAHAAPEPVAMRTRCATWRRAGDDVDLGRRAQQPASADPGRRRRA